MSMLRNMEEFDDFKTMLVTGYYKLIRQEMNTDKIYYDAPSIVIYLTSLYHSTREFFCICNGNLIINEAGDVISSKALGTAYGNIEISSTYNSEYIWQFQILAGNSVITFGIDSTNKRFVGTWFYKYSNQSKYYIYKTTLKRAWGRPAGKYSQRYYNSTDLAGHGIRREMGDVITMKLNTKAKILNFYHNDNWIVKCEDVDFTANRKYRMAVFMSMYSSVKLLSFSKTRGSM